MESILANFDIEEVKNVACGFAIFLSVNDDKTKSYGELFDNFMKDVYGKYIK